MKVVVSLQIKNTMGPDQIHYEMIKCGGEKLVIKVYKLIMNIWKEEDVTGLEH